MEQNVDKITLVSWFPRCSHRSVPIGQYFLNDFAKHLQAHNFFPLFPCLRGLLRVELGQLIGHPLHLAITEVRDQNSLQTGCVHEFNRFSMMEPAYHIVNNKIGEYLICI